MIEVAPRSAEREEKIRAAKTRNKAAMAPALNDFLQARNAVITEHLAIWTLVRRQSTDDSFVPEIT